MSSGRVVRDWQVDGGWWISDGRRMGFERAERGWWAVRKKWVGGGYAAGVVSGR